jgi:PAS domain S-box-containing protein
VRLHLASRPPTNISLRITVISILVVVTILIQIAVGGFLYISQRTPQFGDLKIQLQQICDQVERHLETPLWNFDKIQIQQIVRSTLLIPAVSRISVTDQDGNIISEGVSDKVSISKQPMCYSQTRDVKYNGQKLGTLEISLTTALTTQRLHDYFISHIKSILVLAIVQIVTLYLLLREAIILPLKAIENFAVSVTTQTGTIPDPPQKLFSLELHSLCESITAMVLALHSSEKNYRSIFDNAIEGIYQSTFDGRFLNANNALIRALGYEDRETLLREITDISTQVYADRDNRDAFMDALRKDGYVTNFETRFQSKDGTIIWGSQNARVVRGRAEEALYIEGMVTDITATKEAMANLAKIEAQLIQAQKMEALGNLTGGIAHDFNNLLQVISGYISLLLLKKDSKDPDYKYLSEVQQAASRASALIKRMLTFSRKVNADTSPLNLNDVILHTVTILERTIPKMITIRTVLSPDLSIIQADANQLEQVILNLANNAVQAMDEGGALIIETENFPVQEKYINTYLQLDPGNYVLMKVTDTGIGMDEATRQRIFEPFFTTKIPGKGTGLGLSSVYGIVAGHGGRITCYSELGIGTTFKIFFPVTTLNAHVSQTSQSASPLTGGSETILLVDDEDMVLDIACDILRQYGYTTLTAHSGEEAIELYTCNPEAIDLLIMDLGMAGMGGKKCLEKLKIQFPEVKVIIASGYGSYEIMKRPDEFGASAFLSKPYTLDLLIRKVREVLDVNLGDRST